MFPEIQFNLMQTIIIIGIPLIFAITLHEVMHGWVAYRLGDPTAKMLGRLTINPIKHIDPLGTILVPALSIFLGGIIFGWAKPIPITWRNLKHLRRDQALIAFAGPFANLLMAFAWGAIASVGLNLTQHQHLFGIGFAAMGKIGIQINAMLFILNLLPIPSFDGGHVLAAFLPRRISYYYDKAAPYGLIILLILWFTHLLPLLLLPLFTLLNQSINSLFF